MVAVLILSSLLWVWRRSSAAGRAKSNRTSETESRQSLIIDNEKTLNQRRANVMSIVYDPSNPCRVPGSGIETPKEHAEGKSAR